MGVLPVIGVLTALVALSSGYTYNQYQWDQNYNNDYNDYNYGPSRYQARTLRDGQECTEEGFFRDSEDCQKFYRCAMLPSAIGNKITRYEFRCPGGTVFDEQIATCNYASQMQNPPQNCRAENPPPAQQVPQVPGIPGQGSSGGDGSQQQPGSNQQFPQLPPNQQQPQVPGGVQQPSNPGGNQQFPQVPSNPQGQQPQVPSNPQGQQPQVPGVQQPSNPQQPSFPSVQQPENQGTGSGGNQQQPGSQSQVPNFPINQPSGGNQQIPGGFPNQPGQQQPQQLQVFLLPNSGRQWYYPQYSQQNRPPISFGLL